MKLYKTISFLVFLLSSSYCFGEICFHRGEKLSGLNKICYYDCINGDVAITVDGFELCPLSIDRN
jgi:hypothetical protein